MNRLYDGMDRLCENLGAFCMALMVVVIFAQVIWRYVLNDALAWPEEMARYLFLWATYIGVTLTMKHKGHLRIEMLPMYAPKKFEPYIDLLCMIFNVVFFFMVVVLGIDMTLKVYSTQQVAICYPFPVFCIWIAIPLFGFMTFLQASRHLYVMVTALFAGRTN